MFRRVAGYAGYVLPDELLGVALKGRYRGQRQKWFAMRFLGDDREIDIVPKFGLKAEFEDWRWMPMDEVGTRIVPFKRAVYERVISDFSHLAE